MAAFDLQLQPFDPSHAGSIEPKLWRWRPRIPIRSASGSYLAALCGELLRRSADSTIASFHQQRQRAQLLPNWSQEHSRAESACDHRRRRTRACLASLPTRSAGAAPAPLVFLLILEHSVSL